MLSVRSASGRLVSRGSECVGLHFSRFGRWSSSSTRHTLPDLKFDPSKGIPGLFSPQGLDIAWFQYQKHLLTQINSAIEKEESLGEFESLRSLESGLLDSNEPSLRSLAAVAAQAYMNEFFFRSIDPFGSKNPNAMFGSGNYENVSNQANENVDLFPRLHNAPPMPNEHDTESSTYKMEEFSLFSFLNGVVGDKKGNNIPLLRELIVTRGAAQLGNGAVWLVKAGTKGSVMNTYGWGTPMHLSAYDDSDVVTSRSLSVAPVLAVNTWEHVYLYDYGVAGKRQFLENVFDCLNWEVLQQRLVLT